MKQDIAINENLKVGANQAVVKANAMTVLKNGKVGMGGEFNGVDDYVDTADIDFGGTNPITICSWGNANSMSNRHSRCILRSGGRGKRSGHGNSRASAADSKRKGTGNQRNTIGRRQRRSTSIGIIR